jgi:two-component system nitrogen regulation response regulator GlnG
VNLLHSRRGEGDDAVRELRPPSERRRTGEDGGVDPDAIVHLSDELAGSGDGLDGVEDADADFREDGSLRWRMGQSLKVKNIVEQVAQVADSNFTILIQGETGTGKELVARAIHDLSSRRHKPFVALDCGAIPETLIESELFGYERGAFTGADRRKEGHFHAAEGGTLFFDEIVNLPLTTQAKLLRVLQERRLQRLGGRRDEPVDVRVVAAYNVPLPGEIRAGRFRPDLYYRLNEFVIVLPPLRERRNDIRFLARRFLAETSMELRRPVRGISDAAMDILLRYPWPGNVRELRNVIRRAVLVCSDIIRPGDLTGLHADGSGGDLVKPAMPLSLGLSLKQIADIALAEAETHAIRQVLRATRGNKTEAARLLKTDYKTLHVKMKRHRIHARDFAGEPHS